MTTLRMGNRCSPCFQGTRKGLCDCFGCGKSEDKDINPADLHSSSAGVKNEKSASKSSFQDRPKNLEVKSSIHDKPINSKFSNFSLHGVQKSSPVTPNSSSAQLDGDEAENRSSFSSEKLEHLFETYKDGNCILAEGIERFCDDLGVDPTEFIVLVIAWKFKASTMCKFTRDEFVTGCTELQVDSIDGFKGSFDRLLSEAHKDFKSLYKFTFLFGLDSEAGQRSLPSDIAVELWRLVFSKQFPALLEPWLQFITEEKIRGVSRDTWMMFLHFTEVVASDLSKYDDSEAWPSVFDDFVEHYKKMLENQKRQDAEEEKLKEADAEVDDVELADDDLLPPPYDPPPYTSKEHLPTLPSPAQGIVTSSASDISNTDVEIPGTIRHSTDNCSSDEMQANNLHSP